MMRSCSDYSQEMYNLTVVVPPAALADVAVFRSEWYEGTELQSGNNVPCWYASDLAAAESAYGADRCGSPHCLKIEDPAGYVTEMDPGPQPWSSTCAAIVLVLLLCACGPVLRKLFPETAARILDLDDDGPSPSPKLKQGTKSAKDLYWGEMTAEQREAAATLGYTKKVWNKDGETETSNKAWSALSSEEQEAAGVLGYTQGTWDAEDGVLA